VIDICAVWMGDGYSEDYPRRLFAGIERHITVPHRKVLITDKQVDFVDVVIQPPKLPVTKLWWYKLFLFAQNNGLADNIFYLDLDVVITGNVDKFISYSDEFCITQDFNRHLIPKYHVSNSSVMCFDRTKWFHLWDKFTQNVSGITSQHRGDQDFITQELGNNKVWFPREWAMSWKWEVKGGGITRNRGGNNVEYKLDQHEWELHKDTSLVVFHGSPDPHEQLEYDVISKNWLDS